MLGCLPWTKRSGRTNHFDQHRLADTQWKPDDTSVGQLDLNRRRLQRDGNERGTLDPLALPSRLALTRESHL